MAYFRAPDPGQMRARVTITRSNKTGVDIGGNVIYEDVVLGENRAAYWQDVLGADTASGQEDRHVLSAQVICRYIPGVEPYCRVMRAGDDNAWDVIGAIDPTGVKQWLLMTVERVVQR